MITIDKMKSERSLTSARLKKYKEEIRKLPNGRLECHVRVHKEDKTLYKWYVVKNGKREYLSKDEGNLASKLAYKRKLKLIVAKLENKLMALDAYIGLATGTGSKYATSKANNKSADNIKHEDYKSNPEIERLAALYNQQNNSKWYDWMHADYFNYKNHPEELTVKSKTGRWVRSRIEAAIDESLADHGLYYRYEDPTEMFGQTIYPDFTIINPKTGRKTIWEHFGKFHDYKYRQNNKKKISDYIEAGYYPNLNFIMTSEAPGEELDLQKIESLIEMFFE